MTEPIETTRSVAVPYYPPGRRLEVGGVDGLTVECDEGPLRLMLWHATQGLPVGAGGQQQGEAVEVNGALLGRILTDERGARILITEAVTFPIHPNNTGGMAVFDAEGPRRIDTALRVARVRGEELQALGDFHSHPNDELRLSGADERHLTRYSAHQHFVAAVASPRPRAPYRGMRAIAFFLKSPMVSEFKAGAVTKRLVYFDENGTPFLQPVKPVLDWKRVGAIGASALLAAALAFGVANVVGQGCKRSGVPTAELRVSGRAVECALEVKGAAGAQSGVVAFTLTENGAEIASFERPFQLSPNHESEVIHLGSADLSTGSDWSELQAEVRQKAPRQVNGPVQSMQRRHLVLTQRSGAQGVVQFQLPAQLGDVDHAQFRLDRARGDGGWDAVLAGVLQAGQWSNPIQVSPGTMYRGRVDVITEDDLVRCEALVDVSIGGVDHGPTPPRNPDPADWDVVPAGAISLAWSAANPGGIGAVRYDVYLSEGSIPSAPPSNLRVAHDQAQTSYHLQAGRLAPGKTYSWRVSAHDASGSASSTWHFTVREQVQPLSRPVLAGPADGVEERNPVELTWFASAGGSGSLSYEVWLGQSQNDQGRGHYSPTSELKFIKTLEPDRYYWSVEVRDAEGHTSKSETRSFTVKAEPPPTDPKDVAIDELKKLYPARAKEYEGLRRLHLSYLTHVNGYQARPFLVISKNSGVPSEGWAQQINPAWGEPAFWIDISEATRRVEEGKPCSPIYLVLVLDPHYQSEPEALKVVTALRGLPGIPNAGTWAGQWNGSSIDTHVLKSN